jgi:prevent-host-death family protein
MAIRDRVGVREIRQNLSVYLERVKRGEALEITEHGRPVALLTPVPERASLAARLAAEGRVTRATRDLRQLGPPPAIQMRPGTPSLSEILQQMREEDDR